MPMHEEKRLMPYTAEEMFKLVADIEKYPEFLPWCKSCNVLAQQDEIIKANLTVGYKFYKESFLSQVTLHPNDKIEVAYLNGPFKYLHNTWTFTPQEDDPNFTVLNFYIDFEFRSKIMQKLIQDVFIDSCCRMVRAFETRAMHLYREGEDPDRLAS